MSETSSFALPASFNRVYRDTRFEHPVLSGGVLTPDGVVLCYSKANPGKPGVRGWEYTSLETSRGGRMYRRVLRRKYTTRGLSRLARRFAADVAAGRCG